MYTPWLPGVVYELSWKQIISSPEGHVGQPQAIRCDNGPELTSRHFLAWCVERQIELVHIQPGKPTQNARVEKPV